LKLLKESEVRRKMKRERYRYASDAEYAAEVGLSRAYVNKMLRGERPLAPRLLRWLGIRRVVVYARS